jgi:hypothetical protein
VVAVRRQAPAVAALTATDEQGFLAVDRVPAGDWRLVATAPGFQPGEVDPIQVGGLFRAVANLVLKPGTGDAPALEAPAGTGADLSVVVQVFDDQQQALAGVRARLAPVGMRADPVRAETGPDGSARLVAPTKGRWRLTLLRAGWTHLVTPALTWGGGELDVVARMLPLPQGAATPVEELMPPARLLPP